MSKDQTTESTVRWAWYIDDVTNRRRLISFGDFPTREAAEERIKKLKALREFSGVEPVVSKQVGKRDL